jgi:hypothetical protein
VSRAVERDYHPDVIKARQAVERIEVRIDHAPEAELDSLYAELDVAVEHFHAVHRSLA